MTDPYEYRPDRTAIALVDGPARLDSGHGWLKGRIVGGLPPDTEPPGIWIFTAWMPWLGDFRAYLYGFHGHDPDWGWLAYRYLRPEPSTAYDPRIALPEETP